MKPGDYAWLAMAAGVALYELGAPDGELLSQAVDRYRARRPIATYAVIAYLAGHLARIWPRHLDPLCRLSVWAGRE